jgi:Tol biopolymer transport system component
MNADGSERRMVAPGTWSAKWSPTKNELVYYQFTPSINLLVYDVDKQSSRPLLDKTYAQIWWGLTWSPDGKWVCFRGRTPDGGMEIAAVSAEGEKKGFTVLMDSGTQPEIASVRPCLSWGGDGKQVLVSMKGKGDTCQHLYLLDSDGKQPPKAVPGQDATRDYLDFSWSPDNEKIIFTSAALDTAKDQKVPAPATTPPEK